MSKEDAIHDLLPLIQKHLEYQDEANDLMSTLLDAAQAIAQEMQEMRKILQKIYAD